MSDWLMHINRPMWKWSPALNLDYSHKAHLQDLHAVYWCCSGLNPSYPVSLFKEAQSLALGHHINPKTIWQTDSWNRVNAADCGTPLCFYSSQRKGNTRMHRCRNERNTSANAQIIKLGRCSRTKIIQIAGLRISYNMDISDFAGSVGVEACVLVLTAIITDSAFLANSTKPRIYLHEALYCGCKWGKSCTNHLPKARS